MANLHPHSGPGQDRKLDQSQVITIRHTRQLGTLVYGTRKGDGSGKILHGCRFRFSDVLPVDTDLGSPYWYLPHSRRRSADRQMIERVAEHLRAPEAEGGLGLVVEVVIDDTTPAVGFDGLEAERYERAEARADTYIVRGGRAIAAGNDRWEHVRALRALVPLGQPLLVDHHSYTAECNRRERWDRAQRRAIGEIERGEYWQQRAKAAGRYQARREAVPTTLRRIEELKSQLRRIERAQQGRQEVLWDNPHGWPGPLDDQIAEFVGRGVAVQVLDSIDNGDGTCSVRVHIGISEHAAAVYAAEKFEIREEIAYWEGVIEASGKKVWTKADFAPGDFVCAGGNRWYEVARVNARSVSVPGLYDPDIGHVHTVAAQQHRFRSATPHRPLPYDEITGHMSSNEARQRFPQAFTPPPDGDPPQRPAKKRGTVKLEHEPGAQVENWYFQIAGQPYRALWKHPDDWYTRNAAEHPCTDVPPVKIYKRTGIGKPDEPTGQQINIPEPVHYTEQIHNLVREFAENLTKAIPK